MHWLGVVAAVSLSAFFLYRFVAQELFARRAK